MRSSWRFSEVSNVFSILPRRFVIIIRIRIPRGENFRNDLVTVTFVPLFRVSNCHQQTRIKRQLNTFARTNFAGWIDILIPDGMRDSKIKINRRPRNFEHGICIARAPRRIIQISFFPTRALPLFRIKSSSIDYVRNNRGQFRNDLSRFYIRRDRPL